MDMNEGNIIGRIAFGNPDETDLTLVMKEDELDLEVEEFENF